MDIRNKFLVGVRGSDVVIGARVCMLSPDDALLLAAYLVAMAEPMTQTKFSDVLQAVQNA